MDTYKEAQAPVGNSYSDLIAVNPTRDEGSNIDKELLDEAGHIPGSEEKEVVEGTPDNQDVDKHLRWLHEADRPNHLSYPRLDLPVLIPQSDPGIQNPFSRAWAPTLQSHDVHEKDFLQFIDHLNVCKAASPPFQVLSLAGNVLGFTPIPYAFAVGIGTQAIATAGTVATSRVRITRYLNRVNQDYFGPRGLVARIAKQGTLPQFTQQSESAPLLAPRDDNVTPHPHGLRDRRMKALGGYIAPIQFVELPPVNEERNFIDKLSSKMVAHKAQRKEAKMVDEHSKEKEKAIEENEKLDHEAQKIINKAQRDIAKKPRKRQSIEFKMQEELAKVDKDRRKVDDKFHEKTGDGGEKEGKAAKKFLWIAIGNLDTAAPTGAPAI